MEEYVEALIGLALQRAKVLRGKITNPLPSPEFAGLQSRCESRLDNVSLRLQYLAQDADVRNVKNSQTRIRLLRRAFEDIALLECTGIAALNRVTEDDVFLNKLLFQIHKEINYPLNPPSVTCLSQDYYTVNPAIGLLSVPLAEADFLLHLPDLYHELAHPLLSAFSNPKTEKFQEEYGRFNIAASALFNERRKAIVRQTGPKEYHMFEANILEFSWIKYWSMELFCDFFAAYTLGPAFGWSHLLLTASRGADPYAVKMNQIRQHPPDQARMEAILHALDLLGRKADASEIRDRWNALLASIGSRQGTDYRKACPRELLEQAAVHALIGTKGIGCRLADGKAEGHVHELLNEAWEVFWRNPRKYLAWEKEKVKELRRRYR